MPCGFGFVVAGRFVEGGEGMGRFTIVVAFAVMVGTGVAFCEDVARTILFRGLTNELQREMDYANDALAYISVAEAVVMFLAKICVLVSLISASVLLKGWIMGYSSDDRRLVNEDFA